jgi:hypothetical protein
MRANVSAVTRPIALAAIALLLAPFQTSAAPASVGAYYSVSDNKGPVGLYMDRRFVIPYRDGHKIVHLTTVYATPQIAQGLATPFAISNIGMEFDCAQPRDQSVGLTLFDADGNKLYEQPVALVWSPIPDGSLAARMRSLACGLAPWPAAAFSNGTLADLRRAYLHASGR